MKSHRQKSKASYSLVDNMKYIIILAIPIILINIIIGTTSLINIKKQNHDTIENTVMLYQTEVSSKIKTIQHFMQWTVVHEPLIKILEESNNLYEKSIAITSLRTRVGDTQYATGTDYQYFLYLKEQDVYYNASEMHLPYDDYIYIKKFISNYIQTGDAEKNNFTWNTLKIDDTVYLYYMINYYNRSFFTIINVENLAAPLTNISLGKNGLIELKDLKNETLYSSQADSDSPIYLDNSLLYNSLIFEGDEFSIPFNIHLYCDNFSSYGKLLLFHIFISISSLSLCCILSAFIYYTYKKIITPIKIFSDTLSHLNENEELINLQSTQIHELELASLQFKNLIREIKKLKIAIYEKELEKKSFEITFLQNQIRPHFYLNCLTTIGSMAQLGNYKDIQSMTIFVSQYLRYLFQTDKEMVRIEYELSHIQSYMNIQALRFGSVFTYTCNIDSSDKKALIPPLLLITFVENTLKHGITGNNNLNIVLSVTNEIYNDSKFLKIDLVDSGPGFSQENLNKLSKGESLNTTISHIGISNSIQRLDLLYGTNYKIEFFNEENSGAHIRIFIPYRLEEK